MMPRATLAWALTASAVVHGGLLVAPLAGNGETPGSRALAPAPLRVALAAAAPAVQSEANETPFIAIAGLQRVPLPALRRLQPNDWAPPRAPVARAGVPVDVQVDGKPLGVLSLLGPDLFARTLQEFPPEVAWPVRVAGEIRARYPKAALEAGREGSVVLWIVVDANANVEEIDVADGDPELASAAVESVKAARFKPATQDGVTGIRYPIALEFNFALPAQPRAPDGGPVATTR